MTRTALIFGISGQDGALLGRFLLKKGYVVWGTSRDAQGNALSNLRLLGLHQKIRALSVQPEDFRSVFVAMRATVPDEVYLLAGQSSVGLSFEQPAETIESVALGTLNVLEAARLFEKRPRIYCAGSSECFGDTCGVPATETTPFRPRSPYAVAKASAFWLADNYRDAYGVYVCTGILFNHESALRKERFVTQKIVQSALRIRDGSREKLRLGRLEIQRDWGWAAEYVEAMWMMLQQQTPDDFVIATGSSRSLMDFADAAFRCVGLNWQDHVEQSTDLLRPTEIMISSADPSKAAEKLGWRARSKMLDVVNKMILNELE